MPVGAPIIAPCPVKILAIIPGWYAGQPLVYYELLNGPDAGRIQYVAEQITSIAPPGSFLQQGQVIARYAAHGTAIEFGWSTINGVTLAQSTTGYVEGQVTPAGRRGATPRHGRVRWDRSRPESGSRDADRSRPPAAGRTRSRRRHLVAPLLAAPRGC